MKRNGFIIFLIVGIILGVLLVWQFNTPLSISGGYLSDEVVAKDELMKDFIDEQSFLKSRIVSLREGVESIENDLNEQSAVYNIDLLDSLKKDIGLTEIAGEGLEIVLDDGFNAKRLSANVTDSNLVQASDIRDVVNALNASGSEAISINNQRIIATSVISSLGNSILVNNSQISPPFSINAVGNSELMLQRLLDQSIIPGIYEKLTEDNIQFTIYKKSIIKIPIYNSELKTNFINLKIL